MCSAVLVMMTNDVNIFIFQTLTSAGKQMCVALILCVTTTLVTTPVLVKMDTPEIPTPGYVRLQIFLCLAQNILFASRLLKLYYLQKVTI